MEKSEALEIIESACNEAINTLWNFDSHIKYHRDEGHRIIEAAHELLGLELNNPWETK